MARWNGGRKPVIERNEAGKPHVHRWPMPVDPDTLHDFLADIFQCYWDQLVFGPAVNGAAYEWTCPCAPDLIERDGEFLTIGFNGPHFHLCIGSDTPASLYRTLDGRGAPTSWGFEMRNAAGVSMLTIYFANPFVLPGDQLVGQPDWSRLLMWRDIAYRYLGREPEAFDQTSKGFVQYAAA
ncbi:MAG: hypothetical protein ABT22_06840 [Thiobacillus sp. SCN 64-317]|nr:MAG: hypothetical protein ABT22_06840 [Thiobacillus sp. SCN 64-317]